MEEVIELDMYVAYVKCFHSGQIYCGTRKLWNGMPGSCFIGPSFEYRANYLRLCLVISSLNASSVVKFRSIRVDYVTYRGKSRAFVLHSRTNFSSEAFFAK
jgi:hypothetical protein